MEIDKDMCVGCGNCVPYCTMGVIRIENEIATVNEDECVECNTCYRCCESEKRNRGLVRIIRKVLGIFRLRYDARMDVCPTGALTPPELEWPRSIRRAFSDPTVTHDSTGTAGRGTEEIKTNDVTGRIGPGEAGVVIDIGRPGTGVFFSDIDKMTRALAKLNILFEEQNPLTFLMTDPKKGILKEDILQEKVLSAIIELKLKLTELPIVLQTVDRVAKDLNTVISVGVSSHCEPDSSIPHENICLEAGFLTSLNGKTEMLPPWPIVEMNSLCGHGLVSFNLIKEIVDEVKTERMTPQEGAYQLAKPCECGAFNPTRAKHLLEELRLHG